MRSEKVLAESAPSPRRRTRIQKEKEAAILEAALDLFSAEGFSGTTLDEIASAAGMSRPNLLYYFTRKEDLYAALLERGLQRCFPALQAIRPDGEPIEELRNYIRKKMQIAREFPRETRLYANETLQGAPRLPADVREHIQTMVSEKSVIIQRWIDDGKLVPVDPVHLLFSIWATTRYYATFAAEVGVLAPGDEAERFDVGLQTLETLLLEGLRPR